MADTNFKVWDENNNNVVSTTDFEDPTSQRGTGFVANSAASSSYVNSGLREGTLFATAFMQAIEDAGIDTSSANFASAVSTIQGLIENYIAVKAPKLYRHYISIVFNIPGGDSVAASFTFISNSNTSISGATPTFGINNYTTLKNWFNSLPYNYRRDGLAVNTITVSKFDQSVSKYRKYLLMSLCTFGTGNDTLGFNCVQVDDDTFGLLDYHNVTKVYAISLADLGSPLIYESVTEI